MSAPAIEQVSTGSQGHNYAEIGLSVLAQYEELQAPNPTICTLRAGCRLGNTALALAIMQKEAGSAPFVALDEQIDGLLNRLGAALGASTPVSGERSAFEISAAIKVHPAAAPPTGC